MDDNALYIGYAAGVVIFGILCGAVRVAKGGKFWPACLAGFFTLIGLIAVIATPVTAAPSPPPPPPLAPPMT